MDKPPRSPDAARRTSRSAPGRTLRPAKQALNGHGRLERSVFSFGGGKADGGREMVDLLGGKGANVAEMCRLGLPVPPGFTISTEVCTWYYEHGASYPQSVREEVARALEQVERVM